MNKKGFTLVELLLVMVIIGIIGVITIPNVMKSLEESKKEGGKSVEQLLIKNLELYNEDRKVDLWEDEYTSESCVTITKTQLLSINPDINFGDCELASGDDNSLFIKRTGKNKFKYYANIVCTRTGSVYYQNNAACN